MHYQLDYTIENGTSKTAYSTFVRNTVEDQLITNKINVKPRVTHPTMHLHCFSRMSGASCVMQDEYQYDNTGVPKLFDNPLRFIVERVNRPALH